MSEVFRKFKDGTIMVWKNDDIVFKVLMEHQAETAVIVLAHLMGVSDCIVDALGFLEETGETVDNQLMSPEGLPKSIALTLFPVSRLSYKLELNSGPIWVTLLLSLTQPLTVRMPYLGRDLEFQTKTLSLLDDPFKLAMQTVEMTTKLCRAGLWPTDIRLSNLAIKDDRVVLLDYRSIWHQALSVPAISSVIVQAIFHRTTITPDSALFADVSAFNDMTITQDPDQFLMVRVSNAVAIATKICVAELLGFSEAWVVFSERIDTDIAALDCPLVQLCIVNDPKQLMEFRTTFNPRSSFIAE